MNNNVISQPNKAPRELNQGGTSTSAIVFSEDGTDPIILPLPSRSQLCGATGAVRKSIRFRVLAFGRVEGGGTTNFTATLQCGTSLTAGSNTTIEASSARAVDSEQASWQIEAFLTLDSDSNKLQGHGWSTVNNLHDVDAAIDNEVTSIDPDGGSTLGFVVAGTFSSGFAGNKAYLDGFFLILD